MGATGEKVRRLTSFGYNPAWSPDGKEIVYSTGFSFGPKKVYAQGEALRLNVATGKRVRSPESTMRAAQLVSPWLPHRLLEQSKGLTRHLDCGGGRR